MTRRIGFALGAAAALFTAATPASAAPRYVLSGEVPGLGFGFVDIDSVIRDAGAMRMTTLVVMAAPTNGVDHLVIEMTADCGARTRTARRLTMFGADGAKLAEQTSDQGPRPFAMEDPVDRTLYELVCEGAKPFTPPHESVAEAIASVRR